METTCSNLISLCNAMMMELAEHEEHINMETLFNNFRLSLYNAMKLLMENKKQILIWKLYVTIFQFFCTTP